MTWIRRHLTYANVVATLALFVALGGSSYAALKITGKNVRNNSLTYKDVQRNTLGGTRIKESRLGSVPRAGRADRLTGPVGGVKDNYSSAELLVICPPGTLPAANTCPEPAPRPAQPFGGAVNVCREAGTQFGPGRRLPTFNELKALVGDGRFQLAGVELTNSVYPTGNPNILNVLAMDPLGNTSTVTSAAEGALSFRCVADPING
jgi:hypothetical protein